MKERGICRQGVVRDDFPLVGTLGMLGFPSSLRASDLANQERPLSLVATIDTTPLFIAAYDS
jgi:hypothetical protein